MFPQSISSLDKQPCTTSLIWWLIYMATTEAACHIIEARNTCKLDRTWPKACQHQVVTGLKAMAGSPPIPLPLLTGLPLEHVQIGCKARNCHGRPGKPLPHLSGLLDPANLFEGCHTLVKMCRHVCTTAEQVAGHFALAAA